MKKNVVLLVVLGLIALVAVACGADCECPEPSVVEIIVTKIVEVTPTATATATTQPTVEVFIETVEEKFYVVEMVRFETSPEEYGTFSVSWKIQETVKGGESVKYEEARQALLQNYYDVRDVCEVTYGGFERDSSFASNGGYRNQEPMSEACWLYLEEIAGYELERNDPDIGNDRWVTCSSGDCEIISEEAVGQIETGLHSNSFLLQDPKGRFYSIEENYSRLEPNPWKYPGFEDKFAFPTIVGIEKNTGKISELGIVSWDGTDLCYEVTGDARLTEVSFALPGNTTKCINKDDILDVIQDNDFYNAVWSWGMLREDLFVAWRWLPTLNGDNGTLTLNVVDVNVRKLTAIATPSNISLVTPVGSDVYDPGNAREFDWQPGEIVTIEKVITNYHRAGKENSYWNGYHLYYDGAVIARGETGEEKITLTGDFSINLTCHTEDTECYDWKTYYIFPELEGREIRVNAVNNEEYSTGVEFDLIGFLDK